MRGPPAGLAVSSPSVAPPVPVTPMLLADVLHGMSPMLRRRSSVSLWTARSLVVLVAVLVVVSGVSLAGGGTTPVGGGAGAGEPGQTLPTTVDSCRTITVAGSYVLARDLRDVRTDVCIRIAASDVHLEGDGHVVDGTSSRSGVGVLVASSSGGSLSNVTVTGLRATDWLVGVAARRMTDGELRSVAAVGNGAGVDLLAATDVTVADVRASRNDGGGVRLADASNATFSNVSATENGGRGVAAVRSTDVTLFDVVAGSNGGVGVDLLAVDDAGLSASDVVGNRLDGVLVRGSTEVSILDSTIARNANGVRFARDSTSAIVVSNRIEENDATGVGLGAGTANVSVRQNAVLDHDVGVRLDRPARVGTVAIVANVVTGNDRFGVRNLASEPVDARGNDWGATDGPSSAPADDPDRPFADPVTGRPANGSGDAVSEDPDRPGVSNVRFDPYAGSSS